MPLFNLEGSAYSSDEVEDVLKEALAASEDLRQKLATVRIIVRGGNSPDIVNAIREIFGSDYINTDGDSYITYDMYCTIINLLRDLGSEYTASTL